MLDFMPGKVSFKMYLFVVDYRDMSMWVHQAGGGLWFVGFFDHALRRGTK